MHRDAAGVGGAHRTRVWMAAWRQHVDERLACVTLLVQFLKIELARDARVQRGMDAAYHRRQMRHKGQADFSADDPRQALDDFHAVAMPRHAVGLEIVRGLGEQNMRCLLYTSPSPRDRTRSRMPSSA